MTVRVRLFAALREIVGRDELTMEMPEDATPRTVWERLVEEYPRLAPYGAAIQIAVNQEFAERSVPLAPNDEVAFLPPVSGGAARAG